MAPSCSFGNRGPIRNNNRHSHRHGMSRSPYVNHNKKTLTKAVTVGWPRSPPRPARPTARPAHSRLCHLHPQVHGRCPGLRFAGVQFIRKQWWLSGTADSQYLHVLIAYQYDHSVCVALAGSEKHLPQLHPAVIRFGGDRICLW